MPQSTFSKSSYQVKHAELLEWVNQMVSICLPDDVRWCDGSKGEYDELCEKLAPRDMCIGWSETARQTNLPWVVNNSRFLILPWVRVPNLASHILSLAARQLPGDWLAAYRAQPVLLETLVDGTRYHGGCYRAANWIEVGLTQGRGRMDRSGKAQGVRKHIFLFPLHRHWRERLCDSSGSLSPISAREDR